MYPSPKFTGGAGNSAGYPDNFYTALSYQELLIAMAYGI